MKKLFVFNLIAIVICSTVLASSQLAYGATSTDDVIITAEVSATTPPPGGGPTNSLDISNVNYNSSCTAVAIDWEVDLVGSSASIDSEVIYWPESDSGDTTIISASGGSSPSVTISGLSTLTNYQFTIQSEAGMLDDEAGPFGFTTSCTISSPNIEVRAAGKGTVVDVTYPNIPNIAGIKIYAGLTTCPASGSPIHQSNTAKSANSQETINLQANTTLGQTYGYTVCIFNSGGTYASPVYGEVDRRVYPISVSATPADGAIDLDWSNPTDNVEHDYDFASTRVIRASSCTAGGTTVYQGAGGDYTDTGLTNGQTYYYQISARNSYGEYGPPACMTAVANPLPTDQCLTNLDADSLPDSIELSWDNPADGTGFDFNQAIWRRGNSCSSNINAGSSVYSGSGDNFGDGSVQLDYLYFYSAFAKYNGNQNHYCGCLAATALVEIEEPVELCVDCEVVETDPALVPDFFGNQGMIELAPDGRTVVSVIGDQILVSIDRDLFDQPVKLISVQYQGRTYLLALDNVTGSYRALFAGSREVGTEDLHLSVVYDNQTMANQVWKLKLVNPGVVIDQETGEAISGAQVVLFQNGRRVSGYGVENPSRTGSDGAYHFIVPNGRYSVMVTAAGYESVTVSVNADNQVVARNISLTKKLEILAMLDAAIFDNQTLEKAGFNIIEPLNLALALLNLALLAPLWTSLYYLQSIFSEPLLWLARQKRKGWGVVYNAITKQPIDLAIVRLYSAETKQLIKSRVTDAAGRYSFLVEEGRYYVEVNKGGFSFPSSILQNRTEDYHYTDVYHGKEILIKDGQKGVISANIPLDPDNVTATNKQIIHQYNFKRIQRITSLIGPVVSLTVFIIAPSIIMGILVVVHFTVYALFRRLAVTPVPKSWGIVYDQATRQPIGKAVTRIFAPEYSRMLEAAVTDRYGRYGFLVANNVYSVTADKDGYIQANTGNIDLKLSSTEESINRDMHLAKGQNPAPVISSTPESAQTTPLAPTRPDIPKEDQFG